MKKINIAYCLIVLLSCINTGAAYGQNGFDLSYSLNPQPGFSVYSPLFSILADTHRIFVAGLGHQDTAGGNVPPGNASFISAFDYDGNFNWKNTLTFSSPRYKQNIPLGTYLLAKVSSGKYVLGAMGSDCTDTTGYCDPRPFLYFFKSNGDSLRFAPLPFDSNSKVIFIPQSLTVDNQSNVALAGTYRSNYSGDTAGIWLSKIDSSGNFLWRTTILDTPFYSTGGAACKVMLGNAPNEYILAGLAADSDTAHRSGYALWKTDTAGNVLWRRHIPKFVGWASDEFYDSYDIISARNGSGYYFAATGAKRVQFPNEPPSYRTVFYCGKLNEDGKVVWAKTYERDTLHHDRSYGLVQQPNGDLLIMGQTSGFYTPEAVMSTGSALFCTDSLGHVKWLKLNKKYECPSQVTHQLNTIGLSPDGMLVRGGSIGQMYAQPSCYDTADYIAWLVVTDSLGRRFSGDSLSLPLQEEDVTFAVDTAVAVPGRLLAPLDIVIYPNPATNKAYVTIAGLQGNITDVSLMLYDYTGRLVKTQRLRALQSTLDMKPFPPGFYVVKIQYKGLDVALRKLVKQ